MTERPKQSKQPLVFIAGPTGAGKTEASLAICRAHDGAVVNFDSRQVYRDFPIITAQPLPEEQAVCPHRLFGFLPCEEKITAGRFVDMAKQAISDSAGEGLLPVLVGGTGLYMRSLLEGLAPIPDPPQEVVQGLLAEYDQGRGLPGLYSRLRELDPDYAARIHANDKQRILRALEVCLGTGKSFTWWHERPVPESEYRALKLAVRVPMDMLESRLAQRIELMIEAGALDEARQAMERCPDPGAPGWSGIGCAEVFSHLRGELSFEDMKALWLRNTRAYAKRQYTWFNRDREIQWFAPGDTKGMLDAVERFLQG